MCFHWYCLGGCIRNWVPREQEREKDLNFTVNPFGPHEFCRMYIYYIYERNLIQKILRYPVGGNEGFSNSNLQSVQKCLSVLSPKATLTRC